MSGYTVTYKDVIKTQEITIICDSCQGKCRSSLSDEDDQYYYVCSGCGNKHHNPDAELYKDYKFITE